MPESPGSSSADHLLLFLAREAARTNESGATSGRDTDEFHQSSAFHLSADLWAKVVAYLLDALKGNQEERQAALVNLLTVRTEEAQWPITWEEMTELAEKACL